SIVDLKRLGEMQTQVEQVYVDPALIEYSVRLANATRRPAQLGLRELAQDVTDLALDVLRHRLVLSYEALSDNVTPDAVLTRVMGAIPVPDAPMRERPRGR